MTFHLLMGLWWLVVMSVLKELKKMRVGHPDPAFPDEEIIEILDSGGKPFMLMPRPEAVRQGLDYKAVIVMFSNHAGKIYIQKRSKSKDIHPGLWACSAAGFVQSGESVEEAALREFEEEIGISGVPIKLIATRPSSQETGGAALYLFVSESSNIVPTPNPDEVADGMFISYDELNSLIETFPEVITPALKWAYRCLCDEAKPETV